MRFIASLVLLFLHHVTWMLSRQRPQYSVKKSTDTVIEDKTRRETIGSTVQALTDVQMRRVMHEITDRGAGRHWIARGPEISITVQLWYIAHGIES